MCNACGLPTHILDEPIEPVAVLADPVTPRKFAALYNKSCRTYLIGGALAMMADNIEHVITYWVLWQKFHSPALTGFEVISHWTPFLLLSVYFGGLADRHDCRRVIQAAQFLFMAVSAMWGILFITHSLHIWEACILLVLHGTAGSIWTPGEQLMLYDFVGPDELASAVRMNSTFRSLGILFGPVVGSVLLLGLGARAGIFTNILFYVPLTAFLFRTKFTGHVRDGIVPKVRVGLRQSLSVMKQISTNPTLVSMIILGGLGSFFIGASIQTTMPAFANSLGSNNAGLQYGALLFATGIGGVIGGILLEATHRIKPTVKSAVISTFVYGASILVFTISHLYVLSLFMLFIGGIASLAAMSIGQTVVQLLAPPAERGRVIGLYSVSSMGLRVGSGLTVGLFGAIVGVHWSLGISSAALCVGTVLAGLYALSGYRKAQAAAA